MNLRKILSGVAAVAVATSALAVSAGATLTVVDQNGVFKSGTGNWMPVLYSDGTFDASEKDVVDVGIDYTQIGSVEVVFTPAEPEFFEGAFGGAIVLSSKSSDNSTHNWNGKEYWGVIDEDLDIATLADDKPVIFEKIGDLTYKGVMTVDDTNCVFADAQLVQIAIQEWGQDMSDITVKSMTVKDKSGNVMVSFDETGAVTTGAAVAPAPVEAAPAVDNTPAPATGDVAAATDSSKGSPDTGVADVAAVAGLAIVAAGAVIVSKKRK